MERKTPEQWFQMLKEPYRSEIKPHIAIFYKYNQYESIYDALHNSVKVDYKDLNKIIASIKAGETTYLETETELKLTDLKIGYYYSLVRVKSGITYRYTFKFKCFTGEDMNPIKYYKMYVHHTKKVFKNGDLSISEALIYHSTQKEISLFQDENKEVENELKYGEQYFYYINGSFSATQDLEFALKNSNEGSRIFKAVPIGTKSTKLCLEPIKTK